MRVFRELTIILAITATAGLAEAKPCPPVEDNPECTKGVAKGAADFNCGDPLTLCLDFEGEVFPGDALPTDLRAGDRLVVKVLSVHSADHDNVALEVTERASLEHLTEPPRPQAKSASVADVDSTFTVVATKTSDAIGAGTSELRIAFRRAVVEGNPFESAFSVPVQHSRHFVEFGIALPIAIRGTREVLGPLATDQHTAPRLALSALIFPQGQDDGVVKRGWWNFGIQIATDFDFTISPAKKQYYLGGAWEPISGFGISAGLAVVTGTYLVGGAAVPDSGSMGGPQTVDRYMLRPYIGVHLTSEFVKSAPSLASFK